MKNAQMKMTESILIIIVFFILLIFGLSVYVSTKTTEIDQGNREADRLRALVIANKVPRLHDLRCSSEMCINCDGAIDLLKLEALVGKHHPNPIYSDYQLKNDFLYRYSSEFGYSTINISLIYPPLDWFPEDTDGDPHTIDDMWKDDFLFSYYMDAEGNQVVDPESNEPMSAWLLYHNPPKGDRNDYDTEPAQIPINIYNAYTDGCYFGLLEVKVYSPSRG